MAKLTIKGIPEMQRAFDNLLDRVSEQLVETRASIVDDIVTAWTEGLPVWSGRAVASFVVDATGGRVAQPAPHPTRGGLEPQGEWKPVEAFGATSRMPIGSEPMRGAAMALAKIEAMRARKIRSRSVTISMAHPAAQEIDAAKAPEPGKARNRAQLMESVLAQIRSKYKGIVE